MKALKILFFFYILFFSSSNILSQELIIGEERIEPGIVLIFEGAVKDVVIPKSNNLSVEETNVHIEARVNWDSLNIPEGTPAGGFVPFLKISSVILNQSTGLKTFVDLTPHINLIDNFHYARNIALPGSIIDLYNVQFKVSPPSNTELALHNDWLKKYGKNFLSKYTFDYKGVNFKEIAEARRN